MKEVKLNQVAFAVIRMLAESPNQKLNISALAKQTSVSRAWIYKYMGRTTTEVVVSSIDALAPMITEVGSPRKKIKSPHVWVRNLLRSLNQTMIEATEYPELYRFYFQSLLTKTPHRDRIKYHETTYFDSRVVPQISEAFGLGIAESRAFGEVFFAMRIGIVLYWISRDSHPPHAKKRLIRTVRKMMKM